MALVELNNINITLGGRSVLHDISMSVKLGNITTIVGPNGSGKSTLLRSIVGSQSISSGNIHRSMELRIGYVPQKLALENGMPVTLERFLRMPLRVSAQEIATALEQVGLIGLENQQLSGLSGGQFQRALLARALLGEPNLLLLDEPTQGLDQPATANFYQLIESARQELGCAVLMVSHDLHVVMSASDEVICLNGHICCHGSPKTVSNAPAYRALFGQGTQGALALYQHEHDHHHDHSGCEH